VHCLDSGVLEQGESFVVGGDKLHGRVVAGEPVVPGIDPLAVVGGNDRKVFVSCVDAHHVFHAVCVGFGQSTVSVPVCDQADIHQFVHQAWQLHIIFEDAWWIFKRVVIVVVAFFFLEFVQEISEGEIDAFGTVREVCKSVVVLSFGINYLITCHLLHISLILPQVVCFLVFSIPFEQTRPHFLYIIVVKTLGSHGLIITLRHFLIIWHLFRLLCQESMQILCA